MTAEQVSRLIAMVDHVSVQLLDPHNIALADSDLVPGDWTFVRAAPEEWDLRLWERKRITGPLQGCQVRVMDPGMDVVLPVTATLKEARRKSFHLPLFAFDDEIFLREGGQWVVVGDRKSPLSPPQRQGKFGEIRIAATGFALWVAPANDRVGIDISIRRTFAPIHFLNFATKPTYVDYATLTSEPLKIVCPSGALRVAATTEQIHSDVITRRASVTLYLTPGPNTVQLVIDRAEMAE
jgi:hypothetical protein